MHSMGLNHFYRTVWNAAKGAWQAVSETSRSAGKTKSKRAVLLVAAALGSGQAFAAPPSTELPTGGSVVAGAAVISTSDARMDVTQSTSKTAIEWNSFNIGSAAHLHFQQPAGGVALNRVLDTNASEIYGKLTSTGQVFLVNPNGVFFAPGAQVDVGGIVTSTLNISNADFMQGNYTFQGNSSNAIINQGNITARGDGAGGTIALIAAKITNDGTLTANSGNVLLGAGSKVTLDMGGPVKLQIENDTLETLIQNGGAIKADGGVVWLTSQAASSLASSVINNTGVIEAQALSASKTGEIILFAHGGHMQAGGTIEAEGGFVETSGKTFSISEGAEIRAGHWLIDPVNITIDATLAGTIAAALGSGNVEVSTAGSNTPDTSSGESAGDGDITVNSAIAWTADNTLTLRADNNISVNADITHTGTSAGGVIFKYGQGTTDGGTSTYSKSVSASVNAPSIQWLKGNEVAGIRYAVKDGAVFLGGQFIEVGINPNGSFGTDDDGMGYFASVDKPTTFYGRNGNFGIGMVGDADGFGPGSTDLRIDYFMPGSPFQATTAGYDGTTSASWNVYNASTATVELLPLGADNVMKAKITSVVGSMQIVQTISLEKVAKYFKTDVTLNNTSGVAINNSTYVSHFDPDNTRDVGGSYETIQKIEQTIAASGAAVVSATSKPADAYSALSGGTQSKILYYTTDAQATVGQGGDFWSDQGRPSDLADMVALAGSQIEGDSATADDAMGIVFSLGSIAAGASKSFSFLTSLDNRPMSEILTSLAVAAGSSAPQTSPPVSTTNTVPKDTAVSTAQGTVTQPLVNTSTSSDIVSPTAPPPTVVISDQGSLPVFDVSGGLAFVQVGAAPEAGGSSTTTSIQSVADIPADLGGRDPLGFMRVFVIGGGLNLPEVALNAPGQNRELNSIQ